MVVEGEERDRDRAAFEHLPHETTVPTGEVAMPREHDEIGVELARRFAKHICGVADSNLESHLRRVREQAARHPDPELAFERVGFVHGTIRERRNVGRFDDVQRDDIGERSIAELIEEAAKGGALAVTLDRHENTTQRPTRCVGWDGDDRGLERLHDVQRDMTLGRRVRARASADDQRHRVALANLRVQLGQDVAIAYVQRHMGFSRGCSGHSARAVAAHVNGFDGDTEHVRHVLRGFENRSRGGRVVEGGQDDHDAPRCSR